MFGEESKRSGPVEFGEEPKTYSEYLFLFQRLSPLPAPPPPSLVVNTDYCLGRLSFTTSMLFELHSLMKFFPLSYKTRKRTYHDAVLLIIIRTIYIYT